ncbi:UDP-N-acetylglucosamine 2-epimerase [Pseudomonadales bacterium]|nr:UDP-N-acetylglucosamine 2-epimerase [Pseudomonadales bacterium]
MSLRRIVYITGTRADFGLMRSTLISLNCSSAISLGVIVTGMHLAEKYGWTVKDVENSGLEIISRVPVDLEPETGETMALAISTMLMEFTKILNDDRPDLILVLGDRGEMLAAAVAGLYLSIPVAHIHGGERSGTIDESIRHALSKLSHIHLVATEESRSRLISLGETPDRVHVTGAPGLDGLNELASYSRASLVSKFDLIYEQAICLFVFHPVVQESASAGAQTEIILEALSKISGLQIIGILPNADSGSELIRQQMDVEKYPSLHTYKNLSREEFVSFMQIADVMVGNSSSGIIEAACFGTPVINLGSRQQLRQRNSNVTDVELDSDAITRVVDIAIKNGKRPMQNVYGDGSAGRRIVAILESIAIDDRLLDKVLTY